MAKKLSRWLKRYGPPEILSTAGVYAGFFLAQHFSHITWINAYAGAMGENVGFYGVVLWQRIRARENLWHILAEFGPAELLDSFLSRPLLLYFGVSCFGVVWGLLFGKIVGDLLFYIPVIWTHEWIRKKD